MEYKGLASVDIVIIVGYFVAVVAIGLWSSFKNRNGNVSGYFLAGRSMTWFLIGGSLYGSNIGAEHFIGLSGSAAINGIALAGFELQGMFTLVLLGWLFLPVYISSGVYTMPEYLKKRFGGWRIKYYLASVTLFLSVVVKTSVDLFSGSIFIKTVLNWNLYESIGLQLAVAAISTLGGGLTAVMWTDTMQVMLLVSGAVIVMFLSFGKVGGYYGMVDLFFRAIPSQNATVAGVQACAALPKPYSMHLLRPLDSELPWTGMTFGIIGNAIWYWCCDQVIVQKALAGKNYTHSKGGCLMTGFLKFLPLWMMVFPGMISRILFTDEIACTNPDYCEATCGSRQGCSNIAYPLLVLRILPQGIKGIMIAVMMAAIMSNITSTFNSCSTIFTMDIYHGFRKKASQLELLIVGRVFVGVMIVTSIFWIPIIDHFPSSQLINYVQSVQSYMGPPICAIFIMGIFVPRVNETGAFWGLMAGLFVGSARFVLEISYGSTACFEKDERPDILTKVHYLHFGLLLLIFVMAVTLIVSLFTEPLDRKRIERLTFWHRHDKPTKEPIGFVDSSVSQADLKNGEVTIIAARDEQRCCDVTKVAASESGKKLIDILHCVCGTMDESQPEGQLAAQKHTISLAEDLRWKRVCDATAIALVTFGLFVYVFWA